MPYIKREDWKVITDYFSNRQISYCPEPIQKIFLKEHLCPKCNCPAIDACNTDSDWFQAVGGVWSDWQVYLNSPHDHYECSNNHEWCEKLEAPFNVQPYEKKVYYDYRDQKLHFYEGEETAFSNFLFNNRK